MFSANLKSYILTKVKKSENNYLKYCRIVYLLFDQLSNDVKRVMRFNTESNYLQEQVITAQHSLHTTQICVVPHAFLTTQICGPCRVQHPAVGNFTPFPSPPLLPFKKEDAGSESW